MQSPVSHALQEKNLINPETSLRDYIFTSESVSEGHPDKICDQISDAVLDLFLKKDPHSRLGCETYATSNFVLVGGEGRCAEEVSKDEIENTARQVIKRIGYEQEEFHWKNVDVDVRLHAQSADIAQGVDAGHNKDEGAGDQGIMFGYATRETEELMPAALYYSHRILEVLADGRHSGKFKGLQPDAKSQVTLEFENHVPVRARSVVVSTQHNEDMSQKQVRDIVIPVIQSVLPKGWMPNEEEIYINPTGRFVIGGPVGDAGLTGRKIIVDTYGGSAPHGGGAFSGKDPTKVDRSAAYAARYLAKNVLAAGYADGCTIQLSYAIGVSKPISFYLDTHGTGKVPEAVLIEALNKLVDLRPRGIREHLKLNKPIYSPTAAYGHFGRKPGPNGEFSWEKTDLVKDLQKIIG